MERVSELRSGRSVWALGCLAWLTVASAGCTALSYQPKVTLGVSAEKVPLVVELRDLRDASPADDRSRKFGGTAATASDSMAGDLATGVTDAILENLLNDEVFQEVGRRPERADVVLSGTIRRFYGKANQNAFSWAGLLDPYGVVSALSLLGVPVYTSYGQVDLELTLDRSDGQRIAAYSATKEFQESSSIYSRPLNGIGTKVNRAFSEVMGELRKQLLADRERLVAGARVEPSRALNPEPDPEQATAPPVAAPSAAVERTSEAAEPQP